MRPAAVIAPVRDFFLLEEPERALSAYTPAQRILVVDLRRAGEARLRAARRAPSPLVACVLLRDSIAMLARMHAAARDPSLDAATMPLSECAVLVPFGDVALDDEDADRLRAVFAPSSTLDIDRLDPVALERLNRALDKTAEAMRGGVEARSRLQLRAQRWGRLGAVALVALYFAWAGVRRYVLPVNIAVGKPVHVSSYKEKPPDGHELVDGRPGFTYAVHTNTEDSPNVVIDLQGIYDVDRVVVYNRADGWWDDCLPLVVESSRDGSTYKELGRREEHFGFDSPWKIDAKGEAARYVRVRVDRHSYLTLGKVEVFGKKP
jgi:hypothetical protein